MSQFAITLMVVSTAWLGVILGSGIRQARQRRSRERFRAAYCVDKQNGKVGDHT